MGTEYRLGDKDRERLGAPEWMAFDLLDASIADVSELSDRFGFEIYDWPDVFFGLPDLDNNRRPPAWQLHAGVWIALHANGVDASWDAVGRVAMLKVTHRRTEDGEPGKDAGTADSKPPDTSEPSGTPPSSTSSPD